MTQVVTPPFCAGAGQRGLPAPQGVRHRRRFDCCPVCNAIFVRDGRAPIPVHREGMGDAWQKGAGRVK